MSELKGKHAIISGGGTGVGAEIARELADCGCKVTILGRRVEPLKEVARHHNIAYQICDVTDMAAVQGAYAKARDNFGAIHIVIANAGAAKSVPFSKMTSQDFSKMLDVNLNGVFNCWQAALDDMKREGFGRMIVIASTAGLKGYPYVTAYCAAKHGVIGLTRALSLELAKTSITVNAICPGFTNTPLLEESIINIMEKTNLNRDQAEKSLKASNPQGRFIESDEIASSIKYLCSDGARSINGQALSISGGEI